MFIDGPTRAFAHVGKEDFSPKPSLVVRLQKFVRANGRRSHSEHCANANLTVFPNETRQDPRAAWYLRDVPKGMLTEPPVFSPRLNENWKVTVGILPKSKEIFVGGARSIQHVGINHRFARAMMKVPCNKAHGYTGRSCIGGRLRKNSR